MNQSHGYASLDAKSPLQPYTFKRRELGETDVCIDINYCGVCHSDIHSSRNEWGGAVYPLVPGHEIIGIVKAIGAKVKNFREGDRVGVGCMVNSCGQCQPCKNHCEQFCLLGPTLTYNSEESGNP